MLIMEVKEKSFEFDVNSYVEYLRGKTVYFNRLSQDENFLFEQINSIEPEHLEFLIDLYKNASGPVNILRLCILKAVKSGIKINQNYKKKDEKNDD